MPYQPAGEDKLDAWLASETDRAVRQRVLLWLMALMEDPEAMDATPVPGQRLPVMTAFVPGTDVAVTDFIGRPFQIVVLVRVETVRKL